MKKTLLTGIAALFLATGTAHAVDLKTLGCEEGACRPQVAQRPPAAENDMPRSWNGRWCYDPFISTKAIEVYFPPNIQDHDRKTCSDSTDGIILDWDGYDEETPGDTQSFCAFTEVKEKEKYVSYLVHMRCKAVDGDQEIITEKNVEFQLINDLLFIKRKPGV